MANAIRAFSKDCQFQDCDATTCSGRQWHTGQCNECARELRRSQLRGVIVKPALGVAIVEAVEHCTLCNLHTRSLFRLHHDIGLTIIEDGQWRRWEARPRSMIGRVGLGCAGTPSGITASARRRGPENLANVAKRAHLPHQIEGQLGFTGLHPGKIASKRNRWSAPLGSRRQAVMPTARVRPCRID